jgi:hypothetical protein
LQERLGIGAIAMKVTVWKNRVASEYVDANTPFGLSVLTDDLKDYFHHLDEAEVQINGVAHVFLLYRRRGTGEDFWDTCPELRDADLGTGETPIRDFLEKQKHNCLTWVARNPPKFELTMLGRGKGRQKNRGKYLLESTQY